MNRTIKLIIAALLTFPGITALISNSKAQQLKSNWSPVIPKIWEDRAMQSLELPLANPDASPKHLSADYYYRIPVRPVYKSYPVYHPDKEPRGYMDKLKKQEPEIAFDVSQLKTETDWINAGELVFDAPIEFEDSGTLYTAVRGKDWYEKNQMPTTKDGIFPFMRYVVREKGKVELGILSCAMCHTRVMPGGTLIKGAQGNFPDDRAFAYENRLAAAEAEDKQGFLDKLRESLRRGYAVPWLEDDPNAQPDRMTIDEIASVLEAIPPGTCARQGTSAFYPSRIPDLIGAKERRYFDNTGLVRHRSTEDLMRYAALNQGADYLSLYGKFRPAGELPDPSKENRYSDEQLYALALYIYSLKPPLNPNRFDALAQKGKIIFTQAGCASCHTPPLYTNNKLTPVDGFIVPEDHPKKYDILPFSVGTDSRSALQTRRGTGYYKVPSLKGLWYRGPFEHNGSVATLEDWFNPQRLRDDYVPRGFRGYGVRARAVKGHAYGLELSLSERKALMAFLKTL